MTKQIFVLVLSGLILIFIPESGYLSAQPAPQYYNSNLGTDNNLMPLNSATANKMQWLYVPGIFKSAGSTGTIAPAGLISDIFFRLGSTTSGGIYYNFTIKISQNVGVITSWSDPLFVTGMDTAFYAPVYSLVNPQSNQWHHIPLQNLIPYNPQLSMVVEICVSSGTGNTLLQPIFGASIHQNRYGLYSAVSGTTSPKVIDFGINISQGTTDAGLESFVNLPDTICAGTLPVTVKLKNHGQSVLNSAVIHWKVNNIAQPPYNWTGNLTSNATTNVSIGTYPFLYATSYQMIAYSSNPNNIADTINNNDTITRSQIIIKPSPGLTLIDTFKSICQGDSVMITGTLTGSPPWNLVIIDGSTTIPVTNITQPQFSYVLFPTASQTYTLTNISDATYCTNNNLFTFTVSVHQPPPATISPAGPTAACEGDSVILMATIGLGFSYQWYLNGTPLSNQTNYLIYAIQGGNYTVRVTNPAGCVGVSVPVQVTIHQLPSVSLMTGFTSGCEPLTVAFTDFSSPDIVQWSWNFGDGSTSGLQNPTHTYTSGVYSITLTVTTAFNCTGSMSLTNIITAWPRPLVDIGNDTALLPNQSIILDPGTGFNTYLWSTGDSSYTIIVDSSGTGIGVKTIWVVVSNNFGCTGTDTIRINFTQHPGISEAVAGGSLQIIPNPSEGLFSIFSKSFIPGEYRIEIYSLDGRMHYHTNYYLDYNCGSIYLRPIHLYRGSYILKIFSNEVLYTTRLLIQK